MHAMASYAGQRGPTHHSINSALAAMVALAIHLLRRCTTPPACQSRIKWPKRGCCSNHVDKRGELRVAAHAATSKKGTVGSTGKNTPKAANARLNQEILRVRQLEETIERELRGSLDDIALKTENAVTLTEVAELAKKTANNAEELYAQGVARQDDVSDAQVGAFVAEVEAQRARLELENARLGLAYAVGELAMTIDAVDVAPAPLSNDEITNAEKAMDRVKSE